MCTKNIIIILLYVVLNSKKKADIIKSSNCQYGTHYNSRLAKREKGGYKMSQEKKQSTKKKSGLSKALRTFYGVGDCGFSLMSNVETYYFMGFLTSNFAPGIAGLISTIASIIDACLSWVHGAILNSIKPKKWGRYRSWLILLPWVVPFIFAFQFLKIGDGVLSMVVIIAGFVISHFVWNFPWVANVSMIAVAGKTADDRAQLAATRSAYGNLSKVIFGWIGPPLAAVFANLLGEQNQYAAVAFSLACVMAVLYFVHFKLFDGYEVVEADVAATKKATADKTSGKDLIRALFQNPPLMILMLSDFAKWMFNFVVNGFAIYYFTLVAAPVVAGDGWFAKFATLATFIVITNICGVLGSYIAMFIAKKISTRSTTILFFLIMIGSLVLAYLMYANVFLVMILLSVAMFGYGVVHTCIPALYADTIIYSEWKTKKNATGWISGLQQLPLKVGVVARGVVISACLAVANFDTSINIREVDPNFIASTELQSGIALGFMLIPAIALGCSALLLFFGFKITKEKVEQYQAEIAARK